MSEDIVILPKGTIINLNGFKAELEEDTKVISSSIKEFGVKEAIESWSEMPSSYVMLGITHKLEAVPLPKEWTVRELIEATKD